LSFHTVSEIVQARHHWAAECLLERVDKLLLTVCLDKVSAGRFCEASHIDRALPTRPKGRHPKAYNMHGELDVLGSEHSAQITGRAAACLLAIGEYDDGPGFVPETKNLRGLFHSFSQWCLTGGVPPWVKRGLQAVSANIRDKINVR
jgi:hypothetical protein